MNIHKEIKLEDEICDHLTADGWLYSATNPAEYNPGLFLFREDVLAWVQQTPPDTLESRRTALISSAVTGARSMYGNLRLRRL